MLDTTTNNASYRGGEGQSVFPIPFPFLETTHIRAHIRYADGSGQALAAGVDYSVNRISDANGELILLGSDLPEGGVLTITRLVPLTQDILFHNQGPNSPRAMEEAADKLTMIAQQLQYGIDGCLAVPEGTSADEVAQIIADSAAQIGDIRNEIRGIESGLAAKAALVHSHGMSGVAGLADELAAKADLRSVTESLALKANKTQLQAKADLAHLHAPADVTGLEAALSAKLDANDPRLDNLSAEPKAHAATHAAGGGDPIRPEDIGVLPAPPADGKPYLAAGGGWIEYVAPSGGASDDEGVGTLDHSQLLNRDAADQHPQSAVQHLVRDLGEIRGDVAALVLADADIATQLAGKADAGQLPSLASTLKDGLLAASDKRKLDAIPEEFAVLPEGGLAGDILVGLGDGEGVWKSPAAVAASLPPMTETQKGVAFLSPAGGLELDAGGALRVSADNLIGKAALEARLADFEEQVETLDNRTGALPGRIDALDGGVSALGGRLDSLGGMARVDDAPKNGKPHVRQDGAWTEYAASSGGSSGGNGGGIVGEIRLLPFRKAELPDGWYFCNGDKYSLSTVQGDALNSLPSNMKSDWGIAVSGNNISLPNLFSGSNGYFLRPVNNSARQPGSVQTDAIRNITGSFGISAAAGPVWMASASGTSAFSGAFKGGSATKTFSYAATSHGYNTIGDLNFDASACVATSTENRPMNIGMTPAIYLGV